ncbi:MAG: hypothetical protein O8C61_06920 [Candidatus Methanoperedens sp.]|nr:hypothetical protein [Candidatus Methanoperedens sp.]
MKDATDNELPHYPESKINIKNTLIDSFKFLIFEWKLFIIVLAFYIFKHFIFDQYSYSGNDLTPARQYFEFILMQLPRFFIDLLFWVSLIPIIILDVEEYLAKKQRRSFNWKKMIIRYFIPLFTYEFLFSVLGFLALCLSSFSMFHLASIPEADSRIIAGFIGIFEMILGFILFLAPAIIVLENKTFIDGTKKSVDIIRNKFIMCLTLILILYLLNPSNIFFMFLIINQYAAIPGFNYLQLIQNPGFILFQLILSSGSFIFYNAAIVGFYLSISEREN